MRQNLIFPYIVADIGATSVRFGMVTDRDATTAEYIICELQTFKASSYESFESCLDAYIATLGSMRPVNASIGIAAPIIGDQIQMTNLSWQFSVSKLSKRLGLKRLEVLNDFAALAYSTLYIKARDLTVIQRGVSIPELPRAILGPGTGLGVAALVSTPNGWLPVPGEGGHVSFTPPTGIVSRILELVRQDMGYVSAETLLSGSGLARLHRALALVEGRTPKPLSPEKITAHAVAGTDSSCRDTFEVFCHLLGSIAGDLALIYGARGGIYMGGGILPRVEDILLGSRFTESFQSKGPMNNFLVDIPIYLIKGHYSALLGAAAWFYDHAFRLG